ncbi:MAG: sialate O-acetylesterase [Chthoniobacteraceae bacterium]|nr:sialate O-acetylesterase [Chthoniobacteraceae bacterium]
MKIRSVLFAAAFVVLSPLAMGNVKLAKVFGDHVVLQRDKPLTVWGTADPGEPVSVALGSDTASATADAEGNWSVKLPQRPASAQPAEMTVTGKNKVTVKDLLVGDVWFASGQSNMQFAFFWAKPKPEELASANYPLIRMFSAPTYASDTPRALDRGGWAVCTPGSTMNFSKLGYFFARELHLKLNVPVGIINSSYSGTAIESWMEPKSLADAPTGPATAEHWKKVLEDFPAKKAKYEQDKAAWNAEKAAAEAAGQKFNKMQPFPPSGPGSQYTPSGLYNAMVYPFTRYALRGIIWYQGENNTRHPEAYRTLFPALIKGWRTAFGQDLPFYWVQLTIYNTGDCDWPGLREAQTMTLSVPNTGQAVTIDIGEGNNIHPNNKEEVARRLALLAFARTYGDKSVVDSGPVFERAEFGGNSVRIHFTHVADGLKKKLPDAPIGGFDVAGPDKVFHAATAEIDGNTNTLLVKSKDGSTPVAVRYAWHNNLGGLNLVNSAELPVGPFRTDAW